MKSGIPFKLVGYAATLLALNQLAIAEILPGAAQPDVVSGQLKSQELQQPAAPVQTVTAPEQAAGPGASPEAKKIKFQLNGIILKGNRVYTTAELSQIYKDKLHKTISVADLFQIVQNITNYYRNNGYIISRAILPPQHVKNGVVEVQIIEGFLDKVEVSGNPHGAKCLIKGYGEAMTKCPPLKISRMEKYLAIANETPGTSVKAVLSPSKTKQGAADLNLATENSIWMGYVSYDNYGTRYIGPQQMTANIALNSAISSGDSTALTFTKTPKGGELSFLDLNYNTAINTEGTRWSIGSTRAHTHPLFVLRSSQIDGLNNNYYTGFQFPWIRERTQTLTFATNFNYLDSTVTTLGAPLYTDHVRSIDLGLNYNFADRFYGANTITPDFRQGLPILGYTSDYNQATAMTSRPGGRGDYTKISLAMSRLQAVKGPISLFGLFKGQWAFNPLLSSEQFTFGGNPLGRGYDVAELIGDKGAAGSLELRYDMGVNKFFIQGLQFYTFYDAGMIWNKLTAAGSPGKLSGTSTGIGTRFYMTKYISGNLMWTQTLTKSVAAEELIGEGRRPRVFFSMVASFN